MAGHSPLLQIIRPSTRAQGGAQAAAAERCDVCGAPIEPEHDHLVDLRARAIRCACRACHLLFSHEGAGGGRLRAVPQRYLPLPDLLTASDQVESFDLPIGLAFFFRSSTTERVTAFYPSPAGATESELPLETWDGLVQAVPQLASLATDVEALLVRRRGDELEAFIVPIDATYELVGRIRRAWSGFSGGDEVRREIDEFFARTAERARATPT